MYFAEVVIDVDAGKLRYATHSPQLSEAVQEAFRCICHGDWSAIQAYTIHTFRMYFLSGLRAYIFGAK
jgi:hypothetical protein